MKIKRWHGLAAWAVFSLTAIALVGEAPYVGLGVALGGGVLFGLVNWYAARRAVSSERDVV